ncbi:MAG: hypothetical protein FWD73_14475 [Polyangiaceae bacterium]|nr:hypothetical protein [Polyangiaceae bacterium]
MQRLLLALALCFCVAAFCACEGCRSRAPSKAAGANGVPPAVSPNARLYFVSDLAGALEPCGCVNDQLGGVDNFAALVDSGRQGVKGVAILTAGPLFFMDMELGATRRSQEIAKAGAIASSLKIMNLVGFAPARNDWAAGDGVLQKLHSDSGAAMLAANVTGPPAAAKWIIKDVGGVRLGVIGVAEPDKANVPLDGVTSQSPIDAVRTGVDALKKDGVHAIVVLASVGRGEAKRIADENPDLLAIVVGSAGASGDANTTAPPADSVGDVLIIETANHLQTVAVLDLYVQENVQESSPKGLIKFSDVASTERTKKREELTARIRELRARIATWETDQTIDKRDVDARRRDVSKLEAERDALDKAPLPRAGSFYRYAMRDVRDNLGAAPAIKAQMVAYYKYVNELNRTELAGHLPAKPSGGEPGYAGVEVCTTCHQDSRVFWDKTAHARAYATLVTAYKEYNLDCVGCHVTGYDRPGGSTVTHVDGLKNVQCEACHGPGQNHARSPGEVKIPIAKPGAETCVSCHRPPHVHAFNAMARMNAVVGPGHGPSK